MSASAPLPAVALPGLAPLLDGELWGRWAAESKVFPVTDLRRAARIVEISAAPGGTVVVRRDNATRGGAEAFAIHLYASSDDAAAEFEDQESRPGAGKYAPFFSADPPAVAVPFPGDPALPGLRALGTQPWQTALLEACAPEHVDALADVALETRLEYWRPGRMAVYRVSVPEGSPECGGPWHLELRTEVEAREMHRSERAVIPSLHAAGLNLLRSASLEVLPGSVVRPAPAGEELDDPTSQRGADPAGFLSAVARDLARIHELDVELPHARSPVEESDRLRKWTGRLARWLPEHAHRLEICGEELARRVTLLNLAPSAVVHGNLRNSRLAVRAGEPVWLGLATAARGYPAADLGSLRADLPAAASGFLAHEYQRCAGGRIRSEWMDAMEAACRFRRLLDPLRRLDPAWPLRIRGELQRIAGLLGKAVA